MKEKLYYTAEELAEVLGVSVSQGYRYIQKMNNELKAEGYICIPGKISVKYVEKRFYGYHL